MNRETTRRQLGEFLRAQRELANLSIRQLARLADVSDSYLSQVERGLYRPSADVLKAVAQVLHLQPESLYARLGLLEEKVGSAPNVEEAIRHDPRLSAQKKDVLLRLYRTLVTEGDDQHTAKVGDAAPAGSDASGESEPDAALAAGES